MPDYAAARHNMVEGQVRPNKVTDPRLVDAMMQIPREVFVPKAARGIAYVDEDIPVAPGRFLLEPMVLARMLQVAEVGPDDVVLDVGCATGYSTSVLGRLAATVVGVECDPDLARRATEALAEVGADNTVVINAALTQGYPAQAPYDVIVVNGSMAEVPAAVADQLADHGRLVGVVIGRNGVGEVRLYRRIGGTLSSRAVFEAKPPFLPGLEPKPVFEF